MACRRGRGPTSAAPDRTAGAIAGRGRSSAVLVTGWKPGATGGATTRPRRAEPWLDAGWRTHRGPVRPTPAGRHRPRRAGAVGRVPSTRSAAARTASTAAGAVRPRFGQADRAADCRRAERPDVELRRPIRTPMPGDASRWATADGPGRGALALPAEGRQLWRARGWRSIDVGDVGWAASLPRRCSASPSSSALHRGPRRRRRALEAAAAAGVRDAQRLPGHQGLVPPGATLVGPAPAATALPLVVTLKPRDPAALAAEVQAISDPGSPEYRHFLTPAQFAQQFGPTTATIAQVTSALQQEGLTVGPPSSTGLSLPVSGTVAQVQSAFSTPISKYHLSSGKTGYDNAAAPEVPSSVAPQIEGILGLDTLSPPQPSTSVPQASPATSHPEAAAAPEALAPGQPSPVTGSCASSISSVRGHVRRPRRAGAGAGLLVRLALHVERLRGGEHRRAGRDVGGAGGYSPSDISTLRQLLRHHARRRADHADGRRTAAAPPGPARRRQSSTSRHVLSLAPKADIEVYEEAVGTASTTCSTRSSVTTPPRS